MPTGATGEENARSEALRKSREEILKKLRPLNIPVYSDESVFHSNANIRAGWVEEGASAPIQPKSEGSAIMVLLFMTDDGVLKLSPEELKEAKGRNKDAPEDSTFSLEIGKNRGGYMDSVLYLQAVRNAMAVFKEKYPKQKPILIVDQSSVHLRYANDARRAAELNLKDETPEHRDERCQAEEGENVEMRPGWYIKDGVCINQSFTYPDGRRKGLATLLAERGIPPPEGADRWMAEPARERMSQEPDFVEEQSELAHLMKEIGGELVITPKFHPEFNPVELAWAICKRHTRRNCGYSIVKLRTTIPEALDRLTREVTLLLFDHVAAYREAYKTESNGATAKKIVRDKHKERQLARQAAPLLPTFTAEERALWGDLMSILDDEPVEQDAQASIEQIEPEANAVLAHPRTPPQLPELPYQPNSAHRPVRVHGSAFRDFLAAMEAGKRKGLEEFAREAACDGEGAQLLTVTAGRAPRRTAKQRGATTAPAKTWKKSADSTLN